MIESLFGSKSIERILLFLLVNEKCYPSEVQKAYRCALTPLQNSFSRLEKAGVVILEKQSKKAFYRFNPEYPLLEEMKDLLKKAFVLLSSEEKKILFALKESLKTVKDPFAKQKKTVLYLDLFWERLSKVKNVTIQTQNNQMGFGNVLLTKQKETEILFSIQGKWMGDSLQASSFNNVLRWSLDRDSGLIALEHLRYGPSQPVFLFHLSLVGKNCLQSVDSHLCSSDCYYGRIAFTKQHIRFLWRILGPRKNEVLYHTYS